MNLYEETKQAILQDQQQYAALGHQALTSWEKRGIKDTLALIHEILELDTDNSLVGIVAPLERDAEGKWFLTLSGDFRLTKQPGYETKVRMLPSICSKGCTAYIATKVDFVDFVKNHLSFKDHEPSRLNQDF